MTYDPDCDYCGPEGKWWSKLIPRRLYGVDFNPACYHHDEAYRKGGTETDRLDADRAFLEHMRKAVQLRHPWWSARRYLAMRWVYRYYAAVRIGGDEGRSFNYHEGDDTA
jgi:hypothetical protein